MKRENTHEVSCFFRILEAKCDIKSRSSISCHQNKSVVQVRYLVVSKRHPIYLFFYYNFLSPSPITPSQDGSLAWKRR